MHPVLRRLSGWRMRSTLSSARTLSTRCCSSTAARTRGNLPSNNRLTASSSSSSAASSSTAASSSRKRTMTSPNVVVRAVTTTPNDQSAGTVSGAPSAFPRAAWVQELAARLPPRFVDAPSTYWRGGDTGHNQVHGDDTFLATLHASGAFHDTALLVDAKDSNVLLTMRTGKHIAGGVCTFSMTCASAPAAPTTTAPSPATKTAPSLNRNLFLVSLLSTACPPAKSPFPPFFPHFQPPVYNAASRFSLKAVRNHPRSCMRPLPFSRLVIASCVA